MTQKIFVEYSTLNHSVTKILSPLSEHFEIIVFSLDRESNRLEYEERLMELEIGVEELLLRPENDYRKSIDLRHEFVVGSFNGDDEKAIANTVAIFCNNEQSLEMFREEGFVCVQTGWD